MTNRERIIRSFQHLSSDVIPTECFFTTQEYLKMVKYCGGAAEFEKHLNHHIAGTGYSGNVRPIPDRDEFFIDDFGVIWNRTGVDKDIGVIDRLVIPEPDMKYWKEPPIYEEDIRNSYSNLVKNAPDCFKFGDIGFSMFERFWTLCGMENALMYMLTEEDFTNSILDAICDFNCKIINIANEYPLDGFYFGDDWGQQKGLIMGPHLWRKFIKPRMKRMYDLASKNGKYIIQHSCGDIEEIYPDLIEIGLTCHQTFQPEIYDIVKVKEKFGDKLCFWGAITTQKLLPFATPEKIKEETIRIMNILGKNGGYIASPTHSVPDDVPEENILAMLDVFNHQKEYGISPN